MSIAIMDDNLSAEHLLRTTLSLAWRAWPECLGALLLYIGLDIALDFVAVSEWVGVVALVVFGWVMGVVVTLSLLRRSDVAFAESGATSLVQGLAASLFTGFAIGIGFLLLVIPGLYLSIRWLMVIPVILAEGGGISSAASRSAQYGRGHFWTLFGAFVLLWLPWLIVWLGAVIAGMDENFIFENSVLLPIEALVMILSCCLAVSAYLALRDRGRLEEVFA